MDVFQFPREFTGLVDVTAAPYNADNTGKIDSTAAINRAIQDYFVGLSEAFDKTRDKLLAMQDPNAMITLENRKIAGHANVIFPEILPPTRIIYFPAGTYLVSGTLSYQFTDFRNILGDKPNLEMNMMLRMRGAGKDQTIIKLVDNAPGFEFGGQKPIVSFMQGMASNIAQSNMFEDMTIDAGKGNPGAIGLVYFANNSGAVRNVKIVTEDSGKIGFAVLHDKNSAGLISNLEVRGFDIGIKVMPQTQFLCFEKITLETQRICGVYIGNTVVSFYDVKSNNRVPAFWLHGVCGMTSIQNARLTGGSSTQAAIKYEFGQCLLQEVVGSGYSAIMSPQIAFGSFGGVTFKDKIKWYASNGLSRPNPYMPIEVEQTPVIEFPTDDQWVSVNSFGAHGDGVTDDTVAIQSALKSGADYIYFEPGRYVIDGELEVPRTVKRINFMFADLIAGSRLSASAGMGTFKINGESSVPLVIEDLFAFEGFFGRMALINHASKRTLVLSDIHCQAAPVYFNSVSGGRVFIEDVASTVGGVPGAGNRVTPLPHEPWDKYSRKTPCFNFKGQKVFARLLNAERSLDEVVNDGGDLWILGCKTEEEGTAVTTRHGRSEVYGLVCCVGLSKPVPLFQTDNGSCLAFGSTIIYSADRGFPVMAVENNNGHTKVQTESQFPIRFMNSVAFSPYISTFSNSLT
ncbi:glycosyl hydrolase family 28-related protein [Lacticaseibacillus pantheris]|uniref:glycosyl hydrolase family 28-related protein n=1 Tax=Lacticaseibacillus pantheris TaxID=171523 RepID=UPI0026589EC2|nr:glycosyl hydrolase family 28-related protein [Lacticaseibacillus pantheris]WKF85876.1 glycosyl hydrolase family 28-related protein [Lacticaseibacillus pantheris]